MKHITIRSVGLTLITVLAVLFLEAAALPVEVGHPVGPFLRRLSDLGAAPSGFWNTLPRDSREITTTLEAAARHPGLSAWDLQRINVYLDEFEPNRRRKGTRFKYEDSAYLVFAGAEFLAYGGIQDSASEIDRWAFGSFTPGIEGTYKSDLHFIAEGTVGMERSAVDRFSNYNFNPEHGMPYAVRRQRLGQMQGVITFDGFRTLFGFRNKYIGLEAGQDWNQWGPGHWQHTTLGSRPHFWVQDSIGPSTSDSETEYGGSRGYFTAARRGYRSPGEGPPLPQIRLKMSGTRWEYTKIVAKRTGLHKDSAAYLVAHRAEVRLGSFTFGGTEMLTIGSRGPDGIMLIPGIPLKFGEHEGGDLDNTAMGADVEYTIKGHGRVYAEVFLDDFSGTPLNYWGNKFAWLVGGAWQDPLGWPAEFHIEYARVDPWVYGHDLYNTQMQSYGALLGSTLPPNAHAVFSSLTFPLPSNMTGVVDYRFRQRDLYSPGSSIFENWFSTISNPFPRQETKQFLVKDVETRHDINMTVDWKWKRHVKLQAGVGGVFVWNDRGRPNVTRATPTGHSEVRFTY
jgi:hypothetical protein